MHNYLIITGGSRGIGEQTILRFMRDGWRAINLSRTASTIADVKNIVLDLSSTKNIVSKKNELQAAIKDAQKICLVHNAAFYEPDCVDTMPLANLESSLTINIVSPVVLNQLLIPLMPATSSIIYIGTTLAEKAVPGSASYIISKHALVGLMRATCQDLIDKKIHTVCVNPGLVDTDLLKATMPPATVEFLLKNKIIGKRLIKPEEIANIIYFFATTDVVNGICIAANTGQIAE